MYNLYQYSKKGIGMSPVFALMLFEMNSMLSWWIEFAFFILSVLCTFTKYQQKNGTEPTYNATEVLAYPRKRNKQARTKAIRALHISSCFLLKIASFLFARCVVNAKLICLCGILRLLSDAKIRTFFNKFIMLQKVFWK